VFESTDRRRLVPKEYIPGVEKGIEVGHGKRSAGRLPGVIDFKATLIDGAFHDVDGKGKV
jgi:elongation factor G